MALLIRLLLLFAWLSTLACSAPSAPEAYEETRVVPAGQTFRITPPSTTNRVDITLAGAGGQANIFAPGSGGGVVLLRGVPLTRQDELVAYVAKANPPGTEGWIRALNSAVRTRLGLVVVEAGTSYYDPGTYFYDDGYRPFVVKASDGQRATQDAEGCSFERFGCGGWAGVPAMDGYLKLHFYTR